MLYNAFGFPTIMALNAPSQSRVSMRKKYEVRLKLLEGGHVIRKYSAAPFAADIFVHPTSHTPVSSREGDVTRKDWRHCCKRTP